MSKQIYCDGSSLPNPGSTGIGIVIPGILEFGMPTGHGTNQTAELRAMIEALKLAENGDVIFTDSQYAIGVIGRKWKAKANLELVRQGRKLYHPEICLEWIAGHSGHPWQERADELANLAASTGRAFMHNEFEMAELGA